MLNTGGIQARSFYRRIGTLPFTAPKKLSNGLWIETHYSTAHCINNARRLLERFGYQGNILEVQ